ncbi:MAG TPA: tRNA lysidine(34) synthetase TilS [Terriglobales bacterium]|nr:tRNA lysidine(34) synthetase TilS [Terriglobales bacterium]
MQYHVRVQDLAQRVSRYLRERELVRAGQRVGMAVSGGADSVALFRLLLELRDELGLVLAVVHVNHQIRGSEAEADQQFVTALAARYGLPLHASSADTPAHAAERHLSLEAAARELRYEHFQRLLGDGVLDKVATAHTLDDQAETVLLRLGRGTGITGLAGIYPNWPLESGRRSGRSGRLSPTPAGRRNPPSSAAIIRPLLQVRRCELLSYLESLEQAWREDASNLDRRFARNRVRHKVLPLLESELNPRIRELLAEIAEIARAEEDYWAAEVSRLLPEVGSAASAGGQGFLHIAQLHRHPLALQRRLVRAAAESSGLHLELQHVEQVLALGQAPPAGEKQVMLPEGWRVVRRRVGLQFEPPKASQATQNQDFAYTLPLPGEVAVAETGTVFRATVGPISPERIREAYDPARLPDRLRVRNWRAGDRFWPQHTRAPRKVKELLQEHKVPVPQRHSWPVIISAVSGQEEVIWLRGFPPPQVLLVPPGQAQGLIIQEYALQDAPHQAE